MRVLHTADWHLGKHLEGKSRIEEQELFLTDFVEMVQEHAVDVVIIAGDVYDTSNPPAKAELMFYDTLKKLSVHGERLILVIAGNHDNPERLVAAGPLAMEHGIIMIGTPKTIVQTGVYGKHKVVQSGEGFIELEVNGEKAVVITVPYPSEKRLNEIIYQDMQSEEEQLQSYQERIKRLFHDLQKQFRADTINIAVSHLFAMGSESSGSESGIQLGGSYIVDGSCLPLEAQYIALGHIHKPQVVPNTNRKARYAGSPLHYNKKEIRFQKRCLLVELAVGEDCRVTELDLKVYKPIEIWRCDSIEDAITMCIENAGRHCWVYLEVESDRYIREDEIKEMKSHKEDILEIIPLLHAEGADYTAQKQRSERSFEELFKDFHKKVRGREADDEIVSLLLSIIEEGAENEAD